MEYTHLWSIDTEADFCNTTVVKHKSETISTGLVFFHRVVKQFSFITWCTAGKHGMETNSTAAAAYAMTANYVRSRTAKAANW